MKLPAIAAMLAVVAVPIAVQGAEQPAPPAAEKRYCDVMQPTGSRLGAVRRCRTKAERDQAKQEARQVAERIQSMKPSMCGPGTAIPTC